MIPGKKGHKKYVFATEKEIDYQGWLTAIDKAVTGNPFPSLDEETTANPILNQEEGDSSKSNPNKSESKDEEEEKSEVNIRTTTKPASSAPPSMSGPLQKKSPNVMKGWQKRFTKIQYPGEIVYYSTVSLHAIYLFLRSYVWCMMHNIKFSLTGISLDRKSKCS